VVFRASSSFALRLAWAWCARGGCMGVSSSSMTMKPISPTPVSAGLCPPRPLRCVLRAAACGVLVCTPVGESSALFPVAPGLREAQPGEPSDGGGAPHPKVRGVVRGGRSATSAWTVRKNARKRWYSTSKAQRKRPQDRRTPGTQAARRGSGFRRVIAQPKTGSPQPRSATFSLALACSASISAPPPPRPGIFTSFDASWQALSNGA
jgi:hypothetical protein